MIQFLAPLVVAGFTKQAVIDVAKWVALRALLIGLVTTLVPIAIYQGWSLIASQIMEYVMGLGYEDQIWSGNMIELTGLGAWLGERFQIVLCFQIISSALVYRFLLSFIRR
jgi:hypothetical protein